MKLFLTWALLGTSYSNVPVAEVRSKDWVECESKLEDLERLLNRKGVDIILERQGCDPDSKEKEYVGRIYFMN